MPRPGLKSLFTVRGEAAAAFSRSSYKKQNTIGNLLKQISDQNSGLVYENRPLVQSPTPEIPEPPVKTHRINGYYYYFWN